MNPDSKIYIAGHRGLVGSALARQLRLAGFNNLITRTRQDLDLMDSAAVARFFQKEKPEFVFLAAAKVGGIQANSTYPAEFIHQNLAIQTHVIHEAWRAEVKRLLFLGSSCIYPRECPQPMKEEYLLTGPLEPTNRPYAVAKIAGIEMCWAYNRQYSTRFLPVMPTNLYGPGDNYDLERSHVIPAMVRKMHEAKLQGKNRVTVFGTGKARREFLYVDDMAEACVFLIRLPDKQFLPLVNQDRIPPLVNIGVGKDMSIRELAERVREGVGFTGELDWDGSQPDGTPRKLMDVAKLTALGWTAPTGLREGLEKAYADFLKQPQRV
ncbi:MAG: GDP-L-fucose synthase family protein [Nitrospinaceae bacterium]